MSSLSLEQKRAMWKRIRALAEECLLIKQTLGSEPGVAEAQLFLELAALSLGGAGGVLAKVWKAPKEPQVGKEPGVDFLPRE